MTSDTEALDGEIPDAGSFDAGALLAGSRGRRVCVEVASALAGSRSPLGTALFWADYHLGGGGGVLYRSSTGGSAEPVADPVAEPAPTPREVAELIDGVPVDDGVSEHTLANVIRDALYTSVDRAMYWQTPDGTDAIGAEHDVRGALARVAERVLRSPSTAWWSNPIDVTAQWSVAFDDEPQPASRPTAASRLAHWRAATLDDEARAARDRPLDPRASWSGTWWSTPPRGAVTTTRAIDGDGPIGMRLVEDRGGWSRATARRVIVPDGVAVYEIGGADAWVELCRRHPLEVTASRRHDWFRTTGRDGRWLIPDWSEVAREWAAVHLSVAGYLSAAGAALPVSDEVATVIAGWEPDQTYWLADAVRETADVEEWVESRDGEWSRPQAV